MASSIVRVAFGVTAIVVLGLLLIAVSLSTNSDINNTVLTHTNTIKTSPSTKSLTSPHLPTTTHRVVALFTLVTIIIIVSVALFYSLTHTDDPPEEPPNTTVEEVDEEPQVWFFSIVGSVFMVLLILVVVVFVVERGKPTKTPTGKPRINPFVKAGTPQGTPPKISINDSTIALKYRLASFNIDGGVGAKFTLFDEEDVDLIFLQEGRVNVDRLGRFELLDSNGSSSEVVSIFHSKSVPKDIFTVSKMATIVEPSQPGTSRYAICVEFQDLRICNVHLEGGASVDAVLFEKYVPLYQHKIKLLQEIVNFDPHIILGDFNCAYAADETKRGKQLEKQMEYFKNVHKNGKDLSKEESVMVEHWNYGPMSWLKSKGYRLVPITNEELETTRTSKHGYIVDHVFTKLGSEKFKVKVVVMDCIDSKLSRSDHNPLFITVNKSVES